MSYSSRKPYYDLDRNIVDFYRNPTRFLAEGLRKESEMEKPYLSPEYSQMHLDLVSPTWPEWKRPELPEFPELPEIPKMPIFPEIPPLPIIPAVPEYSVSGIRIKRGIGDCSTWCQNKKIECGESTEIQFETNLLGGYYMGERFVWEFSVATDIAVNCLRLTDKPDWGIDFIGEKRLVTLTTEDLVNCLGTVLVRGRATFMGVAVTTIFTVMETYPGDPPTLFSREVKYYGYATLQSSCFETIKVDCPYWFEDWEGPLVTSNHDWTDLAVAGSCAVDTPDAVIYSFTGKKVLKLESEVTSEDSYCYCQPLLDLRVSPEEPLNLELYSGFECQAYLAEFSPQTYTSARCHSACEEGVHWTIYSSVVLEFAYRPVGSSEEYTEKVDYGFRTTVSCDYITVPPNPEDDYCDYTSPFDQYDESFATFRARVGSWSNLPPLYSWEVVPWLNSNYELTRIRLYANISLLGHAIAVHGATSMKVYFSDLILTPA